MLGLPGFRQVHSDLLLGILVEYLFNFVSGILVKTMVTSLERFKWKPRDLPLRFQTSTVGYNVLSGVLESIAAFLMAISGIKASRVLFLRLISNIFHLPLTYFDKTPRGRVLNILSEDLAEVDYVMPFTVRSMLNVILQALASFGIILANLPLFLVALLPLGVVYYFLQVQ